MGFKLAGHKMTLSEKEMLHEKHCRKCGKEIYVTPGWAYKDPSGYYCSWKCFNHRFDGADGKSIKAKMHQPRRIEQLSLDGELIRTFDNAYDAALEVDGLFQSIYTICGLYKKGIKKKYKKYYWRYEEEPKVEAEAAKDENNLTEGQ